jgi:hypothetical protein
MTRKILLGFLLLSCAVGLAFNVYTVISRETALARESTWRFRVAGFDPLDPFRGRFIEFNAPDLITLDPDANGLFPSWLDEGDEFYALLERNSAGFGRVSCASEERPESDGDWLRVRYLGNGRIEPVFSRYYVNASRADTLDREFASHRDTAYITVRISGGVGVITGVGFANER